MRRSFGNIAVLIFLLSLIIYYFFKPVITDPNSYFFEAGTDAYKSYYIPAYYIKYDHGIHFTGMNYPYGEHVMYTDNQFPVAYILQLIQNNLFSVADYTTAIVNLLMILSFFPCAIFLFLILAELRIPPWYAIFVSIGITLFSPQVLRMEGHFSLSYMFFIPMIWYFFIRMLRSDREVFWMSGIVCSIIFFGLIHLYYLAIIESFLISFLFFYSVFHLIRRKKFLRKLIYISATILLPAVLIELFIHLTDPVTDRTKNPWGFFFNYASWGSVFKPPNWNFLKIFGHNYSFPEGYAYIGLIGLVTCVLVFLKVVGYIFRGQFRRVLLISFPDFLLISLFASVPVLLFSMAYPWRWHMENALSHFPLIKQFRSTGRFAWIFYYVFSVFSAYYFFLIIRLFLIKHVRPVAYVIFAGIIVAWYFDGYYTLREVVNQYKPYRFAQAYFSKESYMYWLKNAGYSPEDFQAIISFPFFHIGSEKFWLDGASSLVEFTKASYSTGLPSFDSYLARTSISQTLKSVQTASASNIEKGILKDLVSDKPILLIVAGGELSPSEKIIISKADSFYSNEYIKLYKLSITALQPDFKKVRNDFYLLKDTLLLHRDNYYSPDTTHSVIIDPLSRQHTGFLEDGVLVDSGQLKLFRGTLNSANDSGLFEFSVWEKSFIETYDFPTLYYRQYDKEGKLIEEKAISPKSSEDIYRDWVRCSLFFTLENGQNTLEFFLQGEKIEAAQLLIRPAKKDVYYQLNDDGSFVMNNYYIPPVK